MTLEDYFKQDIISGRQRDRVIGVLTPANKNNGPELTSRLVIDGKGTERYIINKNNFPSLRDSQSS